MKQTFMALAVIATALAAAAFTTPKEEKAFTDYYFRVNPVNNQPINSTGIPPTGNYGDCENETATPCSRSYTGYYVVSPGVYGPAGTLKNDFTKSE